MANVPETFPGVKLSGFDPKGELLWDNSCSFCRTQAQSCALPNRPYQSALERLPDEVRETASHQMLWIAPDGSVYGGSRAWIKLLEGQGRTKLAWLLSSPLIRPFTRLGYRLVAQNRFMLGALQRSQTPPSAPRPGGPGGN